MRTAVDTNVLAHLLGGNERATDAERLLADAGAQGAVVLSPVVYAEMLARPSLDEAMFQQFLREVRIVVDYALGPEVWSMAGRRFSAYAVRRRQYGGGEAKRLLADFIIGAHAMFGADRLLTFDGKRYRTDFPEVVLVEGRV